ncbi:MAG: alpha/beta hydrolase [Rhizonema sp. PD37]|nr:alpha/beta hydrolase [Rhizonema sp. PD37]
MQISQSDRTPKDDQNTALVAISDIRKTSSFATFNDTPLFDDAASYKITIAANNDLADIYYPNLSNLKTGNDSLPIALLLPGAKVDKSNYSTYASLVARYGFVVVVPNHTRSIPQFRFEGLLPEPSQINAVLSQMKTENLDPTSPVCGVIDMQKLGLLGHSAGGYTGLSAIANVSLPFSCDDSFNRPAELLAGAFFGSFLQNILTQEFVPINNSGIPIALLHGDLDSINTIDKAKATYEKIHGPKSFITICGANHYSITNINNPPDSGPDRNIPTIAQDLAIETIARWSGLFLRAHVLNEKGAFNYLYSTDDAKDTNVTMTSTDAQS